MPVAPVSPAMPWAPFRLICQKEYDPDPVISATSTTIAPVSVSYDDTEPTI